MNCRLPSLSILIPAYNDAATIKKAVGEADEVGSWVATQHEILVINDGSADATGRILTTLKKDYANLRLITHASNQGYGSTIKELYRAGRFAWLFSIPGDWQVGAQELVKLLPYQTQADMIIGWRRQRRDPLRRLIQSAVYNRILSLLFGLAIHDINSVRLLRRKILGKIKLISRSAFVDAELVIRAKQAGFRIIEVPIDHRPSAKPGGGGGRWWTVLPTILEMLKFKFVK